MNSVWAKQTMHRILNKLEKTIPEIGAGFPHATNGAEYDKNSPDWWTAGFWPGILWMAYQQTKSKEYADIANKIEEKMDCVLDSFELVHHDAGFMWQLSSGANYLINGNKNSRLRLLKAANILAARFNIKGNFIRAWNSQSGWAIVDCTMNLALLYWAANETNDPRFFHIAEAHAETVLKYFVREDGSVNHVVSFDPESGDFIEALPGQAATTDSAWSRGSAWALYGLALAYRHLRKERFLVGCKRVANYFLANLPDDYVCHWDFRVAKDAKTPKDTSAAACAACGLLELSQHISAAEADTYSKKAYQILRSLTENYSNFDNVTDQALLREGTGDAPHNINVNAGLIYGDYFYMEAISRLIGNEDIFWYSFPKNK